jgi:hypothetical protein
MLGLEGLEDRTVMSTVSLTSSTLHVNASVVTYSNIGHVQIETGTLAETYHVPAPPTTPIPIPYPN